MTANLRQATEHIPERSYPYPPRFRWLKRGAAAILSLLVLLLIARAWAVHRAKAAFDAEVADLRARGKPASIAELYQSNLPDEQNAAVYLQRAARSLITSAAFEKAAKAASTDNSVTEAHRQSIDRWIGLNASPLSTVRAARRIPGVRSTASPAGRSAMFRDDRSRLRLLVRLVRAAGDSTAARGDAVGLAQSIRDELTIERIMWLVPNEQLEAFNAHAQARKLIADRIASLISTLGSSEAHAAFIVLRDDLLDDRAEEDGFRTWITAEQVSGIEAVTNVMAPKHASTEIRWRFFLTLFRAPIVAEVTEQLHDYDKANELIAASSFPGDGDEEWMSRHYYGSGVDTFEVIMLGLDRLAPKRITYRRFEFLTSRRMQAVAVAVRLFQADHANHYPQTLEELVPRYLQQVPLDPYSRSNRPLQYRPPPFARIYSVGRDGQDQGGDVLTDDVFLLEPNTLTGDFGLNVTR